MQTLDLESPDDQFIRKCAEDSINGLLDNACNACGIAQTLAKLYTCLLHTIHDSDKVNKNPIVRLYLQKLLDLNGYAWSEYYAEEENYLETIEQVKNTYALREVSSLF